MLVRELDKSTDLFLADKINVLRTMLRERPADREALEEEVELETAARQYEQFYIRLLDEHDAPVLMTPGMATDLDLARLAEQTRRHPGRTVHMNGKDGAAFPCDQRYGGGGQPVHAY